jgi:nicotinamidase-related amidase
MSHPNTLDPANACLLVIDMQESFRPHIADFSPVAQRIATMVKGAALLEVPILVTEQYRKGLGETVPEVRSVLPPSVSIVDKTAFSSCGAPALVEQLKSTGRKQVIVCGIEAHVCVNQTVHDLLAAGHQVHLLTDAITARSPLSVQAALPKMQRSGALPSTIEMALFELMRDARHPKFKEVQKLVK